jgi:hypothetical protein
MRKLLISIMISSFMVGIISTIDVDKASRPVLNKKGAVHSVNWYKKAGRNVVKETH